jgi:transcription antitermination factor NusG
MQKNWYVIYTRPQCEKKVASLLTKKKVENFVPFVSVETNGYIRKKIVNRPLFKSYVFAFTTEQEISLLKHVDGAINILYWLGKPAVINAEEIMAIKDFSKDYSNVNVERLLVNNSITEVNSLYNHSFEIDGNVIAVKNKTIKISLPSLGYAITADLKEESIFGKGRVMSPQYTFAQS